MAPTTVVLLVGIGAVFAGIFLSLTALGVFTNEAKGVPSPWPCSRPSRPRRRR